MRNLILILLGYFSVGIANAQYNDDARSKPKQRYPAIDIDFPQTIAGIPRKKIAYVDKRKAEVAVRYEGEKGTALTIDIYPAERASNRRFRTAYNEVLNEIAVAAKGKVEVDQGYVCVKKDGYTVNGYNAFARITGKGGEMVELYECGNWFLKLRASSPELDSAGLKLAIKEAVDAIEPTRLVKSMPLQLIPEIKIFDAAFGDSLLLACTLAACLKETLWAQENVDSIECLSGFPSLYLDMHIESLTGFATFEDKFSEKSIGSFTKTLRRQLNALIAAGYLDEFVVEGYNMVMKVPEGKTFDFAAYRDWKRDNHIDIDLQKMYYLIYYGVSGSRK